MINPLSLDTINQRAPYHVDYLSDADTYVFTTYTNVELAVYFVDDELIQSALAYQLIVSNVNNQRSPRDKKVQQTILTIFSIRIKRHCFISVGQEMENKWPDTVYSLIGLIILSMPYDLLV